MITWKFKEFVLTAWEDGRWNVMDDKCKVLVSQHDQVKGDDLQDAQRRAQGAAMVLHDLSLNKK